MSMTPKEKYNDIQRYIIKLPSDELRVALFTAAYELILTRQGQLEREAGFIPVIQAPPEGSQWEIVIPAVYLQGEFCVPGEDREPIAVHTGSVLLMRPQAEA